MLQKLNLGCGFDFRQGYINVDFQEFHHPDIVADVRELSMLPSDYFDEIVAQDVLEHLPRLDTSKALAEWNRLLRHGGTLYLRMPNILGVAELLSKPERQKIGDQTTLIRCLFGTQAYTGDWHYTTFTPPLVHHYLEEAGFEILNLTVTNDWLFDVSAVKRNKPIQEPVPVLGAGFYGWEGDWHKGAHSWSQGAASLFFINSNSRIIERRYSFVLRTTSKRHVSFIAPSETKTVELSPDQEVTIGPFDLTLGLGETPFRFETDRPAMPAGEGDPRNIAFSVVIVPSI